MPLMLGYGSLSNLPALRDYRSRRASSFDRKGNNDDWWTIGPGESRALLETLSSGCVKHIWMTVGGGGPSFLRGLVVRMWWDDEPTPSVECPLAEFFGLAFGIHKNFSSLPIQASPEDGRAMNCWWPMPFDRARIEVANDNQESANLYFYVDWEEHGTRLGGGSDDSPARFHCQWRQDRKTDGWCDERVSPENAREIWNRRPNTTADGNYTILDATGSGVYVGCVLGIDVFERQANDWYGEGDDMIFVDGEPWPPALHGTGTEDYFNLAFGPRQEHCAPYHGLTLYSGTPEWPWSGKNGMYRFHVEDPIRFRKSIRVTIEHGHANKLSNEYVSAAFWYQTEPHGEFPGLPSFEDRIPRATPSLGRGASGPTSS